MKVIKEKRSSVLKAAPSSLNEKDRTIEATISTNQVDRDGEIVEPSAFTERLETFKANPVFLWMHNAMEPPIGKVNEIEVKKDRLDAQLQFRAEGQSPLADDIFSLFEDGVLSTFSIGFKVFKMEFETDDDGGDLPPRITDAELFEVSAVSIPANPGAVAKIHKHGIGNVRDKSELFVPLHKLTPLMSDDEVLKRALVVSKRITERRLQGEAVSVEQYRLLHDLKLSLLMERKTSGDEAAVRVLADAVQSIESTLSMVRRGA